MAEGKRSQGESDKGEKIGDRQKEVDWEKEKYDNSILKPKVSTIKETAPKRRKLIPKDLTRQIRVNLAHPDQPYALAPPDKKGKITMFEALHSEGGGRNDEWMTSYENRYTPEGKIKAIFVR